MKILVTGGKGQLARAIEYAAQHSYKNVVVKRLSKEELDITDGLLVETCIAAIRPDAVINTASLHDLKECEKDQASTFRVNVDGLYNLRYVCSSYGILLMNISTDYVFDGTKKKPYTEEDTPNPLNYYGTSKYIAECMLSNWPRTYTVRIASLWSQWGSRAKNNRNFVLSMLKKFREEKVVSVVDDIIMSPTNAVDAAEAMIAMLLNEIPYGLYHLTNEGHCSWYEFAESIRTFLQRAGNFPGLAKLERCQYQEDDIPRPKYTPLDTSKIKTFDIKMPLWYETLRFFIEQNIKVI